MPASDVAKIARAAGEALFGFTPLAYGYQTTLWLGRLRLHVFHRGDPGIALHDHPWPFATLPLVAYVEEVLAADGIRRRQVVRAFRVTRRPAEHTHRILGRWSGRGLEVAPGAVVTLCRRGDGRGAEAWNYVVELAGKIHRIPWRRYLARADKPKTERTEPCPF